MLSELQSWQKVTPGMFNSLVRELKIIRNITGREGIRVSHGHHGIALSLTKAFFINMVQRAITTEAAGSHSYIVVNLYDSQGEEITEGEGSAIEAYASIIGDVNLDHCVARLEAGKDIFIIELPYNDTESRWFIVGSPFQESQDCEEAWKYFGDSDTDGTYRIGVEGGMFKIQKREAGTYNTKLSR